MSENAFELASRTEIRAAELSSVDSRRFGGPLFHRYVTENPAAAPAAVVASLDPAAHTLEEQVGHLARSREQLFTLALLFHGALEQHEFISVPGHGTVTDVGIADGALGVDQNLLVEGTLIVAGDLSVGGQVVLGDDAIVVVCGSLNTSAVAGSGQLTVGGDLRMMFAELSGRQHTLDVGGELDSFLLIQNDRVVRARTFSVGVHAVYPERDAAAAVFRPQILSGGKPDWTAVARAGRAGDDIFVDGYSTPHPAEGSMIVRLA